MPAKKQAKRKTTKVPALNPIEAAFCHLLMQGKSATEAAEALGLAKEDGARYYQRKSVQNYMAEYRTMFAARMAEYEARAAVKQNITRESIAARFMALADIPAHETKGSIIGQVEALKAVVDLYCMKIDPKMLPNLLSQMSDEQLRGYSGTPQ